jgi:hypothetical protein
MKKPLIIILLLFTTLLSFSQNRFGIFAGMNRTNLTKGFLEKPPSEIYVSYGFHIGGLYELEMNDYLSFRPKLIISQQGYRINYLTNEDTKPTYLNLPLNLKFFKKTYLLAGPQFGYIINLNKNEYLYEDVNSFDFGANIGAGREFNAFFLEFNLYQGFIDRIDNIYTKGGKNTVFQLSAGYNFD